MAGYLFLSPSYLGDMKQMKYLFCGRIIDILYKVSALGSRMKGKICALHHRSRDTRIKYTKSDIIHTCDLNPSQRLYLWILYTVTHYAEFVGLGSNKCQNSQRYKVQDTWLHPGCSVTPLATTPWQQHLLRAHGLGVIFISLESFCCLLMTQYGNGYCQRYPNGREFSRCTRCLRICECSSYGQPIKCVFPRSLCRTCWYWDKCIFCEWSPPDFFTEWARHTQKGRRVMNAASLGSLTWIQNQLESSEVDNFNVQSQTSTLGIDDFKKNT